MALYTLKSQQDVARMLNAPKYNPNSQTMYNALGRDAGVQQSTGGNKNFFQKRWDSIENAFGTTGAAIASKVYDDMENAKTEQMLKDNKTRMNDIAKKYGYKTYQDVWDARDKAEAEGDTATLDLIDRTINPELQAQANTNAQTANEKAAAYDDYRKNNYVSQKINQDPGKFAGSAMNTLSTAADVMALGAGIPTGALINGAQGAWEGVADELEQNGLQNFSAKRAGQNALIGAATGAVTGAINKGVSNKLATKDGNMFKGGNVATRALNKFNSQTVPGKVLSTVGAGAARGAQSGLVGGAVGAGLSSALNGVELGQGVANALQGAGQGAMQGALSGGVMAGANLAANAALNKVSPNAAAAVLENQKRNAAYGDKLSDQFKGAWNSGDSAIANRINDFRAKADNGFGLKYNQLSGTGTKAVDYLLNRGNGEVEAAVKSPSVGELTGDENVDLVYGKTGKNGYGLAHIEEKHGREVARKIPSILENGTVVDDPRLTNDSRITLVSDDNSGAVRLDWDGKEKQWVVTAYEGLPNSSASSANGQIADSAVLRGSSVQDQNDATVDEIISQNRENVNQKAPSGWDRLAQESGYKDYDSVVEAYKAANPGVKVGENDAGKITAWLDKNPGGWNPNMVEETPIAKKASQLGEVPTSEQIKNKRLLVEEIQKQFYPVGKEVKRGTKPSETFYNLYKDWGLSDGDDIRVATSFADKGALIPQMVREVAGEAGVIDVNDAQNMVMNMKLNKQASSKVLNAIENIIDSTDTTIVGGKQGVDALQLQRALEQAASDARGTNYSYRIGNSIVDETTARNFERVARNIGDKLDDAVVANGAVQRVINNHADDIAAMKNAIPNNEQWTNAIDNKIVGAKNMSDLRSSMKDLVRSGIYIKAGDDSLNTVGSAIARNGADVPTTKAGVRNKAVNWVFDKINDSKTARDLRLANYDKGIQGNAPTNTAATNNAVVNPSVVSPAEIANTTANYNPATQIYNAIGRTEGLNNGEQARTAGYLTEAAQNMDATTGYTEPLGASTVEYSGNSATTSATQPSTSSTSIYNALYGNSGANYNVPRFNSIEEERAVYFYPPTGDYWTDMLSQAMRNAKNAEDYSALGSLYEMYQDALANAQKTAQSTSNSTASLNATQQAQLAKLDAADSAIDELETLFDKAGGGKQWVAGTLQSIAGDWGWDSNAKTYNDMAEGLVNQIAAAIGKTDALNTEGEVKRALKLIPQLTDDATTAKNKLEELRRMLSTTKASYNAAYGLSA